MMAAMATTNVSSGPEASRGRSWQYQLGNYAQPGSLAHPSLSKTLWQHRVRGSAGPCLRKMTRKWAMSRSTSALRGKCQLKISFPQGTISFQGARSVNELVMWPIMWPGMSNRPRTQSLPLTAATFGYTDFDNGAKGELVHDTTKFAPCSMIGTTPGHSCIHLRRSGVPGDELPKTWFLKRLTRRTGYIQMSRMFRTASRSHSPS